MTNAVPFGFRFARYLAVAIAHVKTWPSSAGIPMRASFVVTSKGRQVTREGRELSRVVVVEFPSFDDALACYNSDIYQAALPFSEKCFSEREFSIVESI